MIPIPEDIKWVIDEDKWGRTFNLKDDKWHTQEAVNGWITLCIETYKDEYRAKMGKDMWDALKEDFGGWETHVFQLATLKCLRALRNECIAHKCAIPRKNSTSYAQAFASVILTGEYYQWDEIWEKEREKLIKEDPRYEARGPESWPSTKGSVKSSIKESQHGGIHSSQLLPKPPVQPIQQPVPRPTLPPRPPAVSYKYNPLTDPARQDQSNPRPLPNPILDYNGFAAP
ncbi:hypothetical protein K3495_g15954, partial [Podosphaera aphanis]